MCGVCGCGGAEARIEGAGAAHAHEHEHVGADGKVYRHSRAAAGGHAHEHEHVGADGKTHRHSHAAAGGHAHEHEHVGADGKAHRHSHAAAAGDVHEHVHVGADGKAYRHSHSPADGHAHGHAAPGEVRGARILAVERDILDKNNRFAALNRRLFRATGTLALNLVSSPGSGKTTLLVRSLTDLRRRMPAGVIEGDQQTSLDADRIRATGAPAVQVNTGKGCHLDAAMVAEALPALDLPDGAVLFIENVGNLVCPAGFDLGEGARVLVCSVTEGEDKPLKYPDMFASADLLLVSKVDLLPHLSFDLPRLLENARRIRPDLPAIEVSATTGQGLEEWYAWIAARRAALTG
ncbi:hydrogenase nickel incorporation protein HypB [Paracraurococcus lichenis]|uniref:Hydrogenase maturation factor HypB n=1 Tax=Paracraurococcus lichenis TaxID=3064888 RepID=A0ABT9DZH9_9PROT|nr:hydrogenase nickel incorporation protein HypB [Paracraurococcus sp. LOR1-02]MDO9709322.1 hydrogenase nickel incorporation protein HypB [Paracraurococcus sp. LOR1-02]